MKGWAQPLCSSHSSLWPNAKSVRRLSGAPQFMLETSLCDAFFSSPREVVQAPVLFWHCFCDSETVFHIVLYIIVIRPLYLRVSYKLIFITLTYSQVHQQELDGCKQKKNWRFMGNVYNHIGFRIQFFLFYFTCMISEKIDSLK